MTLPSLVERMKAAYDRDDMLKLYGAIQELDALVRALPSPLEGMPQDTWTTEQLLRSILTWANPYAARPEYSREWIAGVLERIAAAVG